MCEVVPDINYPLAKKVLSDCSACIVFFEQLIWVASYGLGSVELEKITITYTNNSKDNFMTHYQVTLTSVNLILFTLLLVHLILHTPRHHSTNVRSHYLSSPPPPLAFYSKLETHLFHT